MTLKHTPSYLFIRHLKIICEIVLGVAVHLNSTAMDSRKVFVLLWMLLLSTSTGIKLDGNGYVDVTIAISSKVPQDNTLIDKIKVNIYFFVYLTKCELMVLVAFVKDNILLQLLKKII